MGASGGRNQRQVDWEAARQRLTEAVRLVEGALTPSIDRTRQILDARARAAARPIEEPASQEETFELVAFGLAGSTYLIESRFLREVASAPAIVPVPRAPSYLAGIASFRGELAPVYSLALYYGFTEEAAPEVRHAAVLGERRAEFAILVDWIAPAELVSTSSFHGASTEGQGRKHVRGITPDGRILLDGNALIDEQDFYLQS